MLHRPLFVLATCLVLSTLAIAGQATTLFEDIPDGNWARRPASVLAEHEIMPGRTPVDFTGDAALTRYELAWTVSRLYNVDGPPSTFVVLSDMPPGHIATLEVQRVMGFDLVPARKPGHFEGDLPATRADVILALDKLFTRNGVDPPARKSTALYTDVKPGSQLAGALDRIVNRFGLLDAHGDLQFAPNDTFTRYQFLSMLNRSMRYLNPPIAAEIELPFPSPVPSGEGVIPFGSTPEPLKASPTPMPPGQVLRSRFDLHADVLGLFLEELPTDTGLVTAGEQREFSGAGLPGGGVNVEVWSGAFGGTLNVATYDVGFDLTTPTKTSADLLETLVDLQGLYQFPLGDNAQLAIGLDVDFRKTYNLTSVGALYLTADKTYIGGGPAMEFGIKLTPWLALSGGTAIFPQEQDYILPTGEKDITRFAANPHLRLEYTFAAPWLLTLGTSSVISAGGGGSQVIVGGSLGIGATF